MKFFSIALVLTFTLATRSLSAQSLSAQTAPIDPQQLVKDVAYNEVRDRQMQTCWIYRVERTVDGQTRTEEQVESADGPIFRLLAIDGKPLTDEQAKRENARLEKLLNDPSEQQKAKQMHEKDEDRLERLTTLLPKAFLYQYDGQDGDQIRLKFSPNPDFSPPTFEARAFADLAGTLVIDARQKRLMRLQGELIHEVDFGLGLLGRIEKGGTFAIERTPVSATHWKTSLVSIHVSGHIILFKSINKQQDEKRSDFRPLQDGTSLKQAEALLNQSTQPAS